MKKFYGIEIESPLMLGTAQYPSPSILISCFNKSKASVATVSLRRESSTSQSGNNFWSIIKKLNVRILPNTAGCYSAKDAIRVSLLAKELLNDNLVKLEVLADENTLLPNEEETFIAAKELVDLGFSVMVYTTDNIKLAKELEEIGCDAVMPLASPIGTGQGIVNSVNIKKIIKNANIPIIIDAGIGTASDATIAMEIGCDAVLLNSAIAMSDNPILMAEAMKYAVISGRKAYEAKRMKLSNTAIASSNKKDALS